MDEIHVHWTLYRSPLESISRLGPLLTNRAHAEEKQEDKEAESAGEDKEESEEPEAEEAEEEEEEEEEEEPEDVRLFYLSIISLG